VPVEKFHIPALILGAGVEPRRIRTLASQIDLAPTVISLLGLSASHPMIGRDFSRDASSPGRAMMQFDQYYAYMTESELTVLIPERTPVMAHFDPQSNRLIPSEEPPTPAQVKQALAHALLPSILYRNRLYPGK